MKQTNKQIINHPPPPPLPPTKKNKTKQKKKNTQNKTKKKKQQQQQQQQQQKKKKKKKKNNNWKPGSINTFTPDFLIWSLLSLNLDEFISSKYDVAWTKIENKMQNRLVTKQK